MARGRILSQSIALDVEFNKMNMEAQFLFMRAIPHLDRDGLILGNPVALWAKIAPLMPDLMPKTEACISEWTKAKLVIAYETAHGLVLFFRGFTKNQANLRYDREAESLFPPPPGYYRNGNGLEPIPHDSDDDSGTPPQPSAPSPQQPQPEVRSESGVTPAELRQESGVTPPEVKLREGKLTGAPAREEAQPTGVNHEPGLPLSPSGEGLSQLVELSKERFESRRRNEGQRFAGWQAELNLQLAPEKRVPLVDALARTSGLTRAMSDDTVLRDLHEFAVKFHEAGLVTPDSIDRLRVRWLGDPWRKQNHPKPSLVSLFRFASQVSEPDEQIGIVSGEVSLNFAAV